MDRQGRMEKENKTLGTERYENIDCLYINKYIFIVNFPKICASEIPCIISPD